MKQVVQRLKDGKISVEKVTPPILQRGGVLVKNFASLISVGTERRKVDLGNKSYLGKARSRPEDVKRVLAEIKKEGLLTTYKKVMNRLNQPSTLGYSSAGIVLEISEGVTDLRPGYAVACAGAEYAVHSDIVFVPRNLCARIPKGVTFKQAAYCTVGSIALQGLRQANPTLGETILVIGLGLVGQLLVQTLKANGCQVIGVDINEKPVELAMKFGADYAFLNNEPNLRENILSLTDGVGVDATIITTTTTSNEPIDLSAELCRDRGRIVMLGHSKMNLPRKPFYMKELEFKLTRSYGPGRYDTDYEEHGIDYPIGYVRWTERRNMEAFLKLIASKQVDVDLLTTHTFDIDQANSAYEMITGDRKEYFAGIIIEYSQQAENEAVILKRGNSKLKSVHPEVTNIGFIGAGNFSRNTLLPALKSSGATLVTVCNATGPSGKQTAEQFGFDRVEPTPQNVINNKTVGTIFIGTRHNLHAQLAVNALKAGKNVFVEKPLARNWQELQEIIDVYQSTESQLIVGFNRRFSPLVVEMKDFFNKVKEPLVVQYQINAGFVPKDNWKQDSLIGGGRIIGEVCHFVDTIQYITDGEPIRIFAECIDSNNQKLTNADNTAITFRMNNGSMGVITYLANGDSSFSKERILVFGGGQIAILEDFKSLTCFREGKRRTIKGNGKKGHREEIAITLEAFSENRSPISFRSLVLTTATTFKILESLRTGESQILDI